MWKVPFFGNNEERADVSRQSKGKTLVTCLGVSLSSTFRSQALKKKKKKREIHKGQTHEGGRFRRVFHVSLNKCCFSGQESVGTGMLRSKSHLWQLITFFDFQQGRSQCHPKIEYTGVSNLCKSMLLSASVFK